MKLLLLLFVHALLIGLFLYSRLLPHRDRLLPRYQKIFRFFSNLFEPLLSGLRSFIKPVVVGHQLSVDLSQVVLFILLLLLLQIF